MPNFFFHAITTHAILRSQGVNVGIAIFLGKVHTTPSPNIADDIHQQLGAEYLAVLQQLSE